MILYNTLLFLYNSLTLVKSEEHPMKKKPLLLLVATSLLVTIGITTVVSNNHSSIFNKSSATGITQDGNNRTFVLDSTLDFNDNVGTKDIGTLSVYASTAASQDGCVARLTDRGRLIIYCPTGGYVNTSKYRGFGSASISSISLTFNDITNDSNIRMFWGNIDKDNNSITRDTGNTKATLSTTSDGTGLQTLVATSDFINAKSSTYSCLGFEKNVSGHNLDIVSITVEYSCN